MKKELFSQFKKSTSDDWRKKVESELKNNSFQDTLTFVSDLGIGMDSFYARNVPDSSYTKEIQAVQKKEIGWGNTASFKLTEINTAKQKCANFQKIGFDTVKVELENDFDKESLAELMLFLDSIGFDFLIEISAEIEIDIYLKSINSVYFKGFVLKFNSEAIELDLIALQLVGLTKMLDKYCKGEDLTVFLEIPVSPNYLFTIAKLRALRYLYNKICTSYSSTFNVGILAKTDAAFYENKNEHINIVRATTMALSAISGGCNFIEITTFDKTEDTFSLRVAKNISELIKEESYLNKLNDPLAGAYFIETLTYKLILKIWDVFLIKNA